MPDEKPASLEVMSWKQFLESCPPGRLTMVTEAGTRKGTQYSWEFAALEVELYCPICDGLRFFTGAADREVVAPLSGGETFLRFVCRNCCRTSKVIAVHFQRDDTTATATSIGGRAFKLGESPPFGPHTSSRVITLIHPDLDLFLKGRRAESQGMGIGAFAYYRRVVENQKNRLLDEIKRASLRVGVDSAVITLLDEAMAETQFSKAVDLVKDAVPQALKIDNHNPLTLLHSALSEGLHGQTDEICLELATTIRIVLTDLAERLAQATRDHQELRKAVSRLLRKRTEGNTPSEG
jgi:hypothetical protein